MYTNIIKKVEKKNFSKKILPLRFCSEPEVSPLLTQPEHSEVKLLESVLLVGLLGLEDGGLGGTATRSAPRSSLLSLIGIQGNETALRGTTTLFCATGTLAHLSLLAFGSGTPGEGDSSVEVEETTPFSSPSTFRLTLLPFSTS